MRGMVKVGRRVVKDNMLEAKASKIDIPEDLLEEYLGVHKCGFGLAGVDNQVGQVTGLAWTSVGG